MIEVHTGYLANRAGGMVLGFFLGAIVLAVPLMPLNNILAGGESAQSSAGWEGASECSVIVTFHAEQLENTSRPSDFLSERHFGNERVGRRP